jgi:hemoglobin/transferrin/lactoferrin receptor protein
MYEADYPFQQPVSIADSELSPKLGLVYRPTDSIDLYLQYSHGFRAPPFEDANIGLEIPVFNVRAIPNPDLRSESSDGIDVGLRWQGQRGRAHLSLFRTDYDDFIETKVRLGPDPDTGRILFQSQNLNQATIEGVEVGWSLDVIPGDVSIDGSVYWARGENRDNGESLNSVGPAQAVLGVDWIPGDGAWRTRLRATFTDGWDDRDETGGELFQPPGHAVFDLFVTRALGDRARLRAGVTNFTDKIYWSWSDVRGLGPNDPVIPYLARPGRSVVLGVDIDW